MSKTARTLYFIVGIVMPILIGGLHTATHFSQLLTPEIFDQLQKEIVLNGEVYTMWNTWGLMSFMMGISFIVIGIINLSIWLKLSTTDFPPILALLAMMLYLLSVIYVGFTFEASFQFYGGIVGSILALISLLISVINKKEKL